MNSSGNKVSYFVIGNYGDFNIGDEMLLKQVIRELSDNAKIHCNFYIPVRDIEFVKTYHQDLLSQIIPIYVKDFRRIISSIIKSKIIVIGGGGIWSGDTGFLAHFVPFISILGKLMLKKVIFKSIGLYSTASSLDRFFVNLGIVFSDVCSVRDNESHQMLWKINRNRKATRTDDLSLPFIKSIDEDKDIRFPTIVEYEIVRFLKDQGKVIVGISLKPMKDTVLNKRIVTEFSNALNTLNKKYEHGIHLVFFPFAKTPPRTDEEFIHQIINNLDHPQNATIVNHTNPVSWYKAIKELTDVFVGMRYHSIIFSFQAGKPVLCIPYENKVVEFLKDHKKTNCRTVFPSKITEAHIVDFIQQYSFLHEVGDPN